MVSQTLKWLSKPICFLAMDLYSTTLRWSSWWPADDLKTPVAKSCYQLSLNIVLKTSKTVTINLSKRGNCLETLIKALVAIRTEKIWEGKMVFPASLMPAEVWINSCRWWGMGTLIGECQGFTNCSWETTLNSNNSLKFRTPQVVRGKKNIILWSAKPPNCSYFLFVLFIQSFRKTILFCGISCLLHMSFSKS